MSLRAGVLLAAAVAFFSAGPLAANAQDYPSRPVKLLIHTPPGSLVDVLGRLVGQELGERLGQSLIIDNRVGGATMIAVEQLKNSPGVESAAAATPMPFSGFGGSASFAIEGRVAPPGDPGPHGDIRQVSTGYFETMGIRLVSGRTFTDEDRMGSQPVAIIDENLARQYWPNENPVGRHIRNGQKDPWKTIVGVVAPVRHSQVAGDEASAALGKMGFDGSTGRGSGMAGSSRISFPS